MIIERIPEKISTEIPDPYVMFGKNICYAAIGYPRSGYDAGEWGPHLYEGQLEEMFKINPGMQYDMIKAAKNLVTTLEEIV